MLWRPQAHCGALAPTASLWCFDVHGLTVVLWCPRPHCAEAGGSWTWRRRRAADHKRPMLPKHCDCRPVATLRHRYHKLMAQIESPRLDRLVLASRASTHHSPTLTPAAWSMPVDKCRLAIMIEISVVSTSNPQLPPSEREMFARFRTVWGLLLFTPLVPNRKPIPPAH